MRTRSWTGGGRFGPAPALVTLVLVLLAPLAFPAVGAMAPQATPTLDADRTARLEAQVAVREAQCLRLATAPAGPALPDFGCDPFTVTAWVRTAGDGTILAITPASGPWQPQGKTLFLRGGRASYDIGWVGCVAGSRQINDDRWHHVALVGPTAIEIYVDGQLDVRGNLKGGPDADSHILRIGATAENYPSPSALKGLLDDVRLYARRLSADEIRAVFEGKPDPSGSQAVARWAFDGDAADSGPMHLPAAVKGKGAAFVEGKTGKALSLDGAVQVDVTAGRPKHTPEMALNFQAPRAAIADLAATFGPKFAKSAEFLARLDALENAARRTIDQAPANPDAARREWDRIGKDLARLRQEALVRANPLLDFGQLVFIRRKTYQASHYYTDYIDGCKFYGGNVCVLNLRDGKVRDLVPELEGGIFGRFDIAFDASKVVFDYKKAPDKGFRIYEVGIDGKGLRQLTFDDPEEADLVRRYRTVRTPTGIPYISGTDDMHPCYLPCGDIAFVSTRCRKGILCDGPDVLTTTVLYRMDKDGGNLRPISFNTVSEATPSVMQDGRILYTRWEYVDKGGSACKCLWAMNPDGTQSVEIYANNITHPTTFIDARDIPGRGNAIVVAGTPHMPMGVGSILRLDTTFSLRTNEPMTSLMPETDTPDEQGFRHFRRGAWVQESVGPLAREPYPLSEKHFLMTYNPDRPWNDVAAYGVYLLDEFGNRELIYKESEWSCWGPQPLRPRPKPPIIPDLAVPSGPGPALGTLVLQDVYVGLTGIERGRVKYLRIMEDLPRPWSARRYWDGDDRKQQHAVVSMDGHLAAKMTHGIVPVRPDGSAYFEAPADRNLFFQALDENYMELQRMRTFVNLRPGEVRGCVGCHEEKRVAPAADRQSMAWNGPPARPVAQPGEVVPRTIHYPTDVQPILDRHCTRCHSGPEPTAKMDLTGTMTAQFSVSYENLISRRLAGNVVDEVGAKHGFIESTDPLVYGSHTSKMVAKIRQGHSNVKLTPGEFIRLVTWIDANAPYYGTYDGRRNVKYKDLPDFRPTPRAGPELLARP